MERGKEGIMERKNAWNYYSTEERKRVEDISRAYCHFLTAVRQNGSVPPLQSDWQSHGDTKSWKL